MASNWIKVEVITPDKPEIYLISEKLNIDPDMVLGKLIRLWVWADQQIANSNADSVTNGEQEKNRCNAVVLNKIAIDRIAFMPGFADALIHAGWLVQDGDAIYFSNFEKHNGKNSKKRALTNDRVAKSRDMKRACNSESNAGCNADSVTEEDQKELPEEEEEEEVKDIDHGASADADDPRQPPEKINYQDILDSYHEQLPEMPQVKILTDARKKHIRTFWRKYQFNDDRWRAYLKYISTNCRWMLEDRPNGNGGFWKRKNLDYLITERCYVAVKEERANDK